MSHMVMMDLVTRSAAHALLLNLEVSCYKQLFPGMPSEGRPISTLDKNLKPQLASGIFGRLCVLCKSSDPVKEWAAAKYIISAVNNLIAHCTAASRHIACNEFHSVSFTGTLVLRDVHCLLIET